MPILEINGVAYDTDALMYDDGSGPKPFTAEMQELIEARVDHAVLQAETDTLLALQQQANTAYDLMFAATEDLIAWANLPQQEKFNLASLGALKADVQAAMFAYRDVPTEYKTKKMQEQYDYLAGRSVEVAFEMAAGAFQTASGLQAALIQKGVLP